MKAVQILWESATMPNEIKGQCVCEMCEWNKAVLYLLFAKDISLGDAEQQGIGNLPGSTGHQDSDGLRLRDTSRAKHSTAQQWAPLTLTVQVSHWQF